MNMVKQMNGTVEQESVMESCVPKNPPNINQPTPPTSGKHWPREVDAEYWRVVKDRGHLLRIVDAGGGGTQEGEVLLLSEADVKRVFRLRDAEVLNRSHMPDSLSLSLLQSGPQ